MEAIHKVVSELTNEYNDQIFEQQTVKNW